MQLILSVSAVLVVVALGLVFIVSNKKDEVDMEVGQIETIKRGMEIESETEEIIASEDIIKSKEIEESKVEGDKNKVDGENNENNENNENKEKISQVSKVKGQDFETEALDIGIDVSYFQGHIDWSKVKEDGVNFAIIRIGNRNTVSGEVEEDPTARYNLQEAAAQGIPVGAYFFSSAINEEEIIEEVEFVKEIIDDYPITYPVVYNCENFQSEDSRQYELTIDERSNLADDFLREIENAGYVGMFYANKYELQSSALWNTHMLELKYRIWVAHYIEEAPDTLSHQADYQDPYAMWQYTNQGSVSGIKGYVDMNVAYFGYSQITKPKNNEEIVQVSRDLEVGVQFEEVQEMVTPKDLVNIRSSMEQGSDDNIIGSIENGIQLERTGIGLNGWSRIIYNGDSAYVISNFITTDLSFASPVKLPDSSFKTHFNTVSEQVTAKDVVNLRNRPSVEAPSEIIASLKNGEKATRIGIAEEGWSEVEYQGQTLYCVSSYLQVVQ